MVAAGAEEERSWDVEKGRRDGGTVGSTVDGVDRVGRVRVGRVGRVERVDMAGDWQCVWRLTGKGRRGVMPTRRSGLRARREGGSGRLMGGIVREGEGEGDDGDGR